MAAVGELREEYGDRVDFVVVPQEATARRQDEIDAFGFTDEKHGLVVFDREGEAAARMPGHRFGEPEIRAAIDEVLAGGR